MKQTHIFSQLLLSMLFCTISVAQTQWTKYSSSPVILKDTTLTGTWEWAGIGQPSCIMVNDTFKMYYVAVGVPSLGDTVVKARISYAWSVDGINWTKNTNFIPVLDAGVFGEWDSLWLDAPEIVKVPGGYNLYYFGDTDAFNPPPVTSAHGLATSTDGVNFTKYSGNPIFPIGDSSEWDGLWVESPALYYDYSTGEFTMWYTGIDTAYFIQIGRATSPDGINWTRDSVNNPVVKVGATGQFDDQIVGVPAVIKSGNVFEMWYAGAQLPYWLDTIKIGYAVSLNGIDWIKYPGNPVMSINDPPVNDKGPWAPDVVFDSLNNEYKMWYEAEYTTLSINIFMATAPRNILNSINCSTTISADTTINAGDSITLTASGGSIFHWQPSAGLNDPTIATPVASPDSTTTYTVLIVGDSCVTTEMVTISVIPLGLNNQPLLKQQVRIYPNPANESVNIYIENGFENEHFIELYSVMGNKIKTKMTSKRKTIMKLKDLPAGIYFIVVYDHYGSRWTKKIIKTRHNKI